MKQGTDKKGWRKLVDSAPGAERLEKALEDWLSMHSIPYRKDNRWGDGGSRYWVKQNDLCCAQSVLPAIQQLGERE